MLFRYHASKFFHSKFQYLSSLRKVQIGKASVHVICVRKKEYLKATIRCANSIWFHNPEIRIVVYLDVGLSVHQDLLMRKFHRRDRATLVVEDDFESWQELKLRVILNYLGENDFFSDADLYWNDSFPISRKGIYFAAEESLLNREPYFSIITAAGIDLKDNSFMANSSFISLGRDLDRSDFKLEVESYFRQLRATVIKGDYEQRIQSKILRLSEQIALSLAINSRISIFEQLKSTDKPMDGGIAESYYLGTTKGWD
jgi:hypothetical protein